MFGQAAALIDMEIITWIDSKEIKSLFDLNKKRCIKNF